jgi:hypothetical protein
MNTHLTSPQTIRFTTDATITGQLQSQWPHIDTARPLSRARRAALVALLSAARRSLEAIIVLSLALLWSIQSSAQTTTGPTTVGQPNDASSWLGSADGILEIRPFAGAFIPTGAQRTLLKDAVLAGGQLSARLVPALAVTGTFAWTPNHDLLTPGAPDLDLYQYDLGLEARGAGWFQGDGWAFTPFVGVGGGGRTYSYSNLNVGSTTVGDGYGSVGAELDYGRIGLRVEGRDYISQFRPLAGQSGPTTNRNDLGLTGGLSVRL